MGLLTFFTQFFENPAVLLLMLPLLIVLFLVIFWRTRTGDYEQAVRLRRRRTTLFFTRLLIFLCLLLALASPYLMQTRPFTSDQTLKMILDNSTSFTVFGDNTGKQLEKRLADSIKVTSKIMGDESKTPLTDTLLEMLQEGGNIFLVTDGYNNIGLDLSSIILQAAKVNASLHALLLTPEKKDMAVTLSGPAKVAAGVNNLFKVHVRGTGDKRARRVVVDIDGTKILDTSTSEEEIPFTQVFTEGTHRITALIEEEDYFPENNRYYKSVRVIEKPDILFYTLKESPLIGFLQQLYDVDVTDSLSRIDKETYYAVVLNDIPAEEAEASLSVLKTYVSDDNGILFIGGESSFDKGGYKGSKVEDLLPSFVAVAEEKDEGIVTIVLALDISKSTSQAYGQGSVAQVEKSIALSVLDNIKDTSQIGVVGFDSKAYVVSKISPLGDKREEVADKIKSLAKVGSDSYVPSGLEAALQMLEDVSGAKNVIFISDGKSGGIGQARALAAEAQARGIKIYGVGVGSREECIRYTARGDCAVQQSEMYGIDAIRTIALAGGGSYFTGEKTPQKIKVLFGEAQQEEKKDTYRLVVFDEGHFITQDLQFTAPITGFNHVIPKGTANLLVTTDSGEPVVTVWRYGVGRVAVLSTDDGSAWAGKLLDAADSLLFTKVLNWLIGDPERKNEFSVTAQDTSLKRPTDITVKAKQQPVAEGLTFYKRDKDIYTATFLPKELGFQRVLGTEFAVNYNKELEGIGLNPQLAELITATGGRFFEAGETEEIIRLVKTQMEKLVYQRWYYRWPFVLLAILFFLFEIFLRRAGRQALHNT